MSANRGGEGGRQTGDDEGFADDESVEEEAMEVVPTVADNEVDEVLNGPKATVYYAVQVPPNTDLAAQQGKDYTRDEIEELMQSEAYQRKISTCHLCGKVWFDNVFTANCKECGNFAMTRPCPICKGQCGRVWNRNLKMSHAYHKDYWEGDCGTQFEAAASASAFSIPSLSDSTEDTTTLTEGLQDLSTS
ncbi:protein pinocchio-like [Haliotis rufescens]|uniref:protein pinocchio-like n=1 Tax=Haliotis rufescens TaxID=6454 RepID=UPI001EB0827B|nr:protein pinocchio-like [Haliotis rufescens]